MKLLLVDDEHLTRQGLLNSVNWSKFGINEVLLADDGLRGLELAREHQPEIVLCDVRMPHMSGIEMLENILSVAPDTISILISGYSDKEYLKAAIKLKAISYIEKPLNLTEVEETLGEAVKQYQIAKRYRQNELSRMQNEKESLARLLTMPESEKIHHMIRQRISDLKLNIHDRSCFITWIVELNDSEQISQSDSEKLQETFAEHIRAMGLRILYVQKRITYHIFHIYGDANITGYTIKSIDKIIKQDYSGIREFHISRGAPSKGISGAYRSYSEAVLLLQSGFFFPSQSIMTPEKKAAYQKKAPLKEAYPNLFKDFADTLSHHRPEDCFNILDILYEFYSGNYSVLPIDAKDTCYRLCLLLQEAEQNLYISSTIFGSGSSAILSFFESFHSFDQMIKAIREKAALFFERLKAMEKENPIVYRIKEYIASHYDNDSLSVRDISEYVDRSVSYICNLFKNETGQTLNQYITEYRLIRAKQLLRDPKIRINKVSNLVGYSDGNYFAKLFKKMEGISPSRYRETMLS